MKSSPIRPTTYRSRYESNFPRSPVGSQPFLKAANWSSRCGIVYPQVTPDSVYLGPSDQKDSAYGDTLILRILMIYNAPDSMPWRTSGACPVNESSLFWSPMAEVVGWNGRWTAGWSDAVFRRGYFAHIAPRERIGCRRQDWRADRRAASSGGIKPRGSAAAPGPGR
jgi:hypothetical protein